MTRRCLVSKYGATAVALTAGLVFVVGAGIAGLAQSPPPRQTPPAVQPSEGIISIPQGTQVEIAVEGMRRFLVGAPNLVGAERSDSGLRLTGKQLGTTILVVWTKTARSAYQVSVVAGAPVPETPAGETPAPETPVAPTPVAPKPVAVTPVAETPVLPPVAVKLQPGESQVLKGRNITRTAVSDPDVVNIVPVSTAEVLVNAVKEGTSTVRVWDSKGLATYVFTVARVVPTPAEIAAAISQQIGIPTITVRVVGDTAILTGIAPTAELAQKAGSVAEASGKKVLNLITVESITAEKIMASLKAALPEEPLTYEVLPDQTVMIKGSVASDEEALRIEQVVQAWIGTPEQALGDKTTQSTQISFVGQPQEAAAEITDRARVRATTDAQTGQVVVGEDFNVTRRVFGGRIPNGPRVVAVLDVNPALAKQILVSARVIEVDRNKLKKLGIQWGEIFGENATQPIIISEERTPPLALNQIGPFKRNTLEASLQALIQDQAARVLSEPKVLIADGHGANIHVGGEIPIPMSQNLTVGTVSVSVVYKPFGIQLTVRPKITSDNRILLTVAPEVSSLDYTNAVVAAGFRIPALKTRRATTTVHMANGESLAIGGLLSSEDLKVVEGLPVLKDIPVIGELFKSRRFTKNETELIILVTPQIVERGARVPIASPGP